MRQIGGTYMANRCPNCGKFLTATEKQCPNCGAILTGLKLSKPAPKKEVPAEPKIVLKNEDKKVVVDDNRTEVRPAPAIIRKGSDPVIITKYETKYVQEPLGFDSVSYFDGKLHQFIGWNLLGWLVTFFTLGICFPLWYAWLVKWECKHTVIRGYREYFDGSGGSLIGRWLLWYFLTIITLTIYGWWTPIRLRKWKVARIKLVKDQKQARK